MTVIERYQEFVQNYGDSLSRYFGRIQVLFIDRMVLKLKRESGINLSHSQFHCLQSLCLKGMKQNELAERLGISKQALSKLLKDLEEKKLIIKKVDPEDTRSRILVHTKKGQKLVDLLIDLTVSLEKEVLETIGKEKFLSLKDTLEVIEEKYKKESLL